MKRISIQINERGDRNRRPKRPALASVSEMRGQDENQNLRGHRTKEETKLGVIKLQIVVRDEPDA